MNFQNDGKTNKQKVTHNKDLQGLLKSVEVSINNIEDNDIAFYISFPSKIVFNFVKPGDN